MTDYRARFAADALIWAARTDTSSREVAVRCADSAFPDPPGRSNMGSDSRTEIASLLRVRCLTVRYDSARARPTEAVREVDLDVEPGETVGVLGESGSGKSTLALALLGLLPSEGRVVAGSVEFEEREILRLGGKALDRLRGDRISMVFQQPGLALSPFLRVGTQISDVLRAHRDVSPRTARDRVLDLLYRVRIEEPESVSRAYPHQLSGGQLQRAVIAQALICDPALLIADEPTAALDTVTQATLIDLLEVLKRELDMALVLISHDLRLLARLADRILVMYAGRIVEEGPAAGLLAGPVHPYPRELLRCLPAAVATGGARRSPLHVIPGAPPSLAPPPPGCAFEARCPDRLDRCASESPSVSKLEDERQVSCWNAPEGVR